MGYLLFGFLGGLLGGVVISTATAIPLASGCERTTTTLILLSVALLSGVLADLITRSTRARIAIAAGVFAMVYNLIGIGAAQNATGAFLIGIALTSLARLVHLV
jgi:hypothetical protein